MNNLELPEAERFEDWFARLNPDPKNVTNKNNINNVILINKMNKVYFCNTYVITKIQNHSNSGVERGVGPQ